MIIHANCVCLNDEGLLILGESGAGKSSLTLELIASHGGVLVADDQTHLSACPTTGRLLASAPARLAGRIEIRGVGIVTMPYQKNVPVTRAYKLVDAVDRLPEPKTTDDYGISIPLIHLMSGHHANCSIIKVLTHHDVRVEGE